MSVELWTMGQRALCIELKDVEQSTNRIGDLIDIGYKPGVKTPGFYTSALHSIFFQIA